MDAIAAFIVIVAGLVGLDFAAIHWGVDSRDGFREDDRSWRVR